MRSRNLTPTQSYMFCFRCQSSLKLCQVPKTEFLFHLLSLLSNPKSLEFFEKKTYFLFEEIRRAKLSKKFESLKIFEQLKIT